MQATMIAGLLGTLTVGSSIDVPPPTAYASTDVPLPAAYVSMACPSPKSEAHRELLVKADEQVEAGDNAGAARSFVAAFDAMDLGNQVAGTGKFTADRAVTAYLDAWRIGRDVGLLQEAERFLVRYLETLDRGVGQGCIVDRKWGEDKLEAVRAEMPKEGDPPPEGDPTVVVPPPKQNCVTQAAIIGTDRVGVALTTVGASVFFAGVGLLVTGVALPNLDKPQAFTITGGVIMGVGTAFLIPGAIRLATWRRSKERARLGLAPWTGRGLAGVTVSGRFGAWR